MLESRLFLATLFFLLAVPVYAQMIFQDNFDDAVASKGTWEIISGTWDFKDGMLYSQSENEQFTSCFVPVSEWSKDKANEFDEYTIEFKFMRELGRECCRPVWRAIAEPLPKTSGERKGFYEWNLGGWTNTRSVLRRFDPNGAAVFLLDSQYGDQNIKLGATVEDSRWYTIKIVVRNKGKTEAYLDDEKAWEIEDNTWTDGRIGLANWFANMFFDDYRVYGPAGTGQAVEPDNSLVTTWGNIRMK